MKTAKVLSKRRKRIVVIVFVVVVVVVVVVFIKVFIKMMLNRITTPYISLLYQMYYEAQL